MASFIKGAVDIIAEDVRALGEFLDGKAHDMQERADDMQQGTHERLDAAAQRVERNPADPSAERDNVSLADRVAEMGIKADETAREVKDSTLAGMDDAEQRAAEARDSAADIVRRTGDSIADSARQAGDSVAEGVRAVRDSVAETAGEVQGRAERAVDDTKAAVRNATDEARSRMDEARDAANKDITTDTSTMRTTATITGRDAEPPLVQKLADRIGGEVDKLKEKYSEGYHETR